MILDERQYARNVGPCLSALRNQQIIFVPDPAAGPGTAAALNCYAFDTSTMNALSRATVGLLAASFSGILQLALRIHSGTPSGSGLTPEMDPTVVVDAAVGLLMMQS